MRNVPKRMKNQFSNFFRFIFFVLWSFFYSKYLNFRGIFTITRKIKIKKLIFRKKKIDILSVFVGILTVEILSVRHFVCSKLCPTTYFCWVRQTFWPGTVYILYLHTYTVYNFTLVIYLKKDCLLFMSK